MRCTRYLLEDLEPLAEGGTLAAGLRRKVEARWRWLCSGFVRVFGVLRFRVYGLEAFFGRVFARPSKGRFAGFVLGFGVFLFAFLELLVLKLQFIWSSLPKSS